MKRIRSEQNREVALRRENLLDLLNNIPNDEDFRKLLLGYCQDSEEHRLACTENRKLILQYISRRFNNNKHLTILALVEPQKFLKTLKLQNNGGMIRYYDYSTYSDDYFLLILKPMNPNYTRQIVEYMTKEPREQSRDSYLVIIDIPYPGLIPTPDKPGMVEGLVYEINFGNGSFYNSAEIYYEPLTGNMDRFVKTILRIIAYEIVTYLVLNLRADRSGIQFKTLDGKNSVASITETLEKMLDTTRGTKITNFVYKYNTNFGNPKEPFRTITSSLSVNIRPFRYIPRP